MKHIKVTTKRPATAQNVPWDRLTALINKIACAMDPDKDKCNQ